jgi:hypothetical protein
MARQEQDIVERQGLGKGGGIDEASHGPTLL